MCSALRYQRLDCLGQLHEHINYSWLCLYCFVTREQRHSTASIEQFDPTILNIAPSTARISDKSTIACLRTLFLGEERLTSRYSNRYSRLSDTRFRLNQGRNTSLDPYQGAWQGFQSIPSSEVVLRSSATEGTS